MLINRLASAAVTVATALVLANPALGQLAPPAEPGENPGSEEKRLLGKILFWDEQLSSSDSVACGTCHIPAAAGADPRRGVHPGPDGLFDTDDDTVGSLGLVARDAQNRKVTHPLFGDDLQVTPRVAPGILMSMYSEDNFWDGRARSAFIDPMNPATTVIASGGSLESQAVGPILSDVEMAHQDRSWPQVVTKLLSVEPLALASRLPADIEAALSGGPTYPQLFQAAFGDGAITPARIGMAIAAYERTLVPDQSPWDRFMRGDPDAMTQQQIDGWNSFIDDTTCDNCHVPPHFTDHNFYNIGLRPASEDSGRETVTLDTADHGSFKTPTLRNLSLRSSLTHVGWVTDLQDAVDFYNASALDTGHTQFTDFQSNAPAPGGGPSVPYALVTFFPGDPDSQAPVLDFIANALTDPRVGAESFPFDRPLLRSETVKILSYDLTGSVWSASRADAVANVIGAENPDIVGLQETSMQMLGDLLDRVGDIYEVQRASVSGDTDHVLTRRGQFRVGEISAGIAALSCDGYEVIDFAVLESIASGESFILFNNALCPADMTFPAGEAAADARNAAAAMVLAETMHIQMARLGAPGIAIGNVNADDGSNTIEFLSNGQATDYAVLNPTKMSDAFRSLKPGMAALAGTQWSMVTSDSTGITPLAASIPGGADAIAASDLQPLIISLGIDTTPVNKSARPGDGSDQTAPSTPSGLAADPVSTSSITLNWNASTDSNGVSRYLLARDGQLLATLTGTSYVDDDVTPNSTYGYSVAAADASGNLSQSATVSATASTPRPPDPPASSGGGGPFDPAALLLLLSARFNRPGPRR